MRLVLTLLVRDESDIIEDYLDFHYAAGVDFVVAADNESTDGTTEVLERHADEGRLHRILLRDPFSQIEIVTQMARLATTDFGADWVINSDADEFWWARGASLKDVLGAVPNRFGSVRGMWRNFVARPGTGIFAERMTIRWQKPTPGVHPFNPHFKTPHRGSPDVEVGGGNHDVTVPGLSPLPGWYPIDVLHFPIRSLEQFERKFMRWWQITAVDGVASNPYYNEVRHAHREGRMRDLYEPFVFDDDALAPGLTDGTLIEDTRVRDALRGLRQGGTRVDTAGDAAVDDGYLLELGFIEERGPYTHAQHSIEAMEARVARLERRAMRAKVAKLVRRA